MTELLYKIQYKDKFIGYNWQLVDTIQEARRFSGNMVNMAKYLENQDDKKGKRGKRQQWDLEHITFHSTTTNWLKMKKTRAENLNEDED